MLSTRLASIGGVVILTAGICHSQNGIPAVIPAPTPQAISQRLAKLFEDPERLKPVTRENREGAYIKLLEGQRHLIQSGDRAQSRLERLESIRLAREAFLQAAELNPSLSEAYTALAEIAMGSQPRDTEEAVRLAELAVRVNANSFGARRLLGRLYAQKSRVGTAQFDADAGRRAIEEWRHVVRLDPRNAEAWAYLSELYEKTSNTDETINSLRGWLSSSPSLDPRFAPENASLRLGAMLLKAGRTRESIETISAVVADEPTNTTAVELLRQSVDEADAESGKAAIDALRQAVAANPTNLSLITLLARVHANAGDLGEAGRILRDSANRFLPHDRVSAASLHIEFGDLLVSADRTNESIEAYESAFRVRGLDNAMTLSDDEREFAAHVFEKMIQVHKTADQQKRARLVIERARRLLGKDDLFADRQLISLLRETGKRSAAIKVVRSVRQRVPGDQGLLRLEATLLAETGRVDEGVALIRKSMSVPPPVPQQSPSQTGVGSESITLEVPAFDAFSNHLFISNLYTQANRGREAIDAANEAIKAARGAERKQIARLTLATAQQMAGDVAAAEATLRELLKETPGNPIALNNLGYFLLERNERIDEAFDLIQQAVKIDPTNPSYLDSLGWAYFKLGKLPEAEKNLRQALRYDFSSGTIHEHLGDVYQKQGKTEMAKSAWSRAASLFSDAADVSRVKKKLASVR